MDKNIPIRHVGKNRVGIKLLRYVGRTTKRLLPQLWGKDGQGGPK